MPDIFAPGPKARYALCLFAGALSCMALEPINFFPAMFVGLSALYWLIAHAGKPATASFYGWLFGFGYFTCGLYWVGNALLVDGNPYWWAWPLAACGLPLALAFFPALACFFAARFSNLKRVSGFISFCGLMAFSEWARGGAFTGFPWNLYGDSWAGVPAMLQILSLSDVYFLTLLTLLWCAAPGFFFASNALRRKKIALVSVLLLSFALVLGFGIGRLHNAPPPTAAGPGIDIHIVQANIPQSEKWDPALQWNHFLKHIDQSKPQGPPTKTKATYIIWAETALSQWIYQQPDAKEMIRQTLALYPGPAYIMTGLLRYEPETNRYFNSLVMIDKAGKISNIYNKNHLVPFGEYIPFQKWIPLEPVAKFQGFSGGGSAITMKTPEGIGYSPVICYEIIFSGAVADEKNRPNLILNVTNDSWYGFSPGPYQHYSQAVFRAIEEGIPVVRVADTGISAVVDPYGRSLARSGLFSEYEKTLALPQEVMVTSKNYTGLHAFFLMLVTLFFSCGYIRKYAN